ncbi:CDP-glucose 4,6-dehydratase [Candidatus Phycosocius bacilliformis]|uniref:CDP-glucose 4,6-dehydratase n=1 Tax=Candidatus Phycosocius bacilliformis TaxID=1445552 RepID=A0A2P2EDD9_9PROT|nr:CDP-glucose 4,6-dehydratase [Candidatus Phycosocius bacilliformis]GBF59051.1 CDP-glucose 4,6-dehydratase [Candidatus Phycosocius bacilliformis]
MSLTSSFWSGRRVFVTGHTGFKGSWLLVMLQVLGARVTGYSLPPPTDPSMFDLLDLGQTCVHVIGDIRDLRSLERAIHDCQPEIVLHLAAQPLVRASYVDPLETYSSNVMGTANLLDACRRIAGLEAIVAITTDKCYENVGLGQPFAETDRLGGFDPYSNSKACCELLISAYRDSFFQASGKGLASARAGNVIGGGDFAADRLIPDAVRAFGSGQTLMIRNPLATRPWQHVLEPLVGYLCLAEKLAANPSFGEGWNFGPCFEDAQPVGQVVSQLVELWGSGASWQHDEAYHPHEAQSLQLNCAKAETRLNWKPRLNLTQALEMSMEWYHVWHQSGDIAALTKRQVNEFLCMQSI